MSGGNNDSRNNDKSESDVEADSHVASSRASADEDGSYVGRSSSDDDFGSGESGAEARTPKVQD